jgi:hypothetical protein
MATQQVLVLALGGKLAERLGEDIRRWSEARLTSSTESWSPEDWPEHVRHEAESKIARLAAAGFTPPVLYRSEHVDFWSMGDVFSTAIAYCNPECHFQLMLGGRELYAAWVAGNPVVTPPAKACHECNWLYQRINEAMGAWDNLVDRRLIVIVRSVNGGLWTDDEVAASLHYMPDWWLTE